MTAAELPRNLQEVRADLMRATEADARREARRRRRVLIVSAAVALAALSGAAAVAGWLADSDARVIAIRTMTSPAGTRTVAATLGDVHVVEQPFARAGGDIADLQIVESAGDDSTICVVLNEYSTGCDAVARVAAAGIYGWGPLAGDSTRTLVYGLAPPGSTVATITAEGRSYRAGLRGPSRAFLIAIPALPPPPQMPQVRVEFGS